MRVPRCCPPWSNVDAVDHRHYLWERGGGVGWRTGCADTLGEPELTGHTRVFFYQPDADISTGCTKSPRVPGSGRTKSFGHGLHAQHVVIERHQRVEVVHA